MENKSIEKENDINENVETAATETEETVEAAEQNKKSDKADKKKVKELEKKLSECEAALEQKTNECAESADKKALSVALFNVFEDSILTPEVTLAKPYGKVRTVNCTAQLQGDRLTLSEIPAFGFAAFEVEI